MLMMCWFYCIPLAKGLFLASGPLLILLSMFILKRGVRRSRLRLRQFSFFCFFIAFAKIFTVDAYLAREYLACRLLSVCTSGGLKAVQGGALLLLVLVSFFLFNVYRNFAHEKPQKHYSPEQVNLPFWANFGVVLVVGLILWLAAPWVGFLTVGHVPQFFMALPWQNLALVTMAVLLTGFWKLEDCTWTYDSAQKDRKKHQASVWTAKDTLWVSVILFLIALAFSYASSDVLSTAMPAQGGGHMNFSLDDIDLSKLGSTPLGQPFEAPPSLPPSH